MAKNKSKVDRDTAIHDAVQGITDLAKRGDFDATEFRGALDQPDDVQRINPQSFIVSIKLDSSGSNIDIHLVRPEDWEKKVSDVIPADFCLVGGLGTYLTSDSQRKWEYWCLGEPSKIFRAIMDYVTQRLSVEHDEEGFITLSEECSKWGAK